MNGMTKLHGWLITSIAIIGNQRQNIPKITDEIIVERDLMVVSRNSPRYAKMVLVPERLMCRHYVVNWSIQKMISNQNPLKNRNIASCHKLFDKLESTEANAAVNVVITRTLRLPYVSLTNPHRFEDRMKPV